MAAQQPESVVDVLSSDHAAIERTLTELRSSADPDTVSRLFEQLCADIVRHDVAEEQYLLPAVREHLDDGKQISAATFAEHESIEKRLRGIEDDDPAEHELPAAFEDLQHAVAEHITSQESRVLPALAAALGTDELNRLGEEVLGSEQLAPTHPRVFVPKSATVSKVTSLLTGLIERSADAGT